MLLVLSVSGETVTLSANKNQHWVLSLTLRRWDFKKPTLGFDKPYVCVRVCVHMCVPMHEQPQFTSVQRRLLYLWPSSVCSSWQFSKDKRFTFTSRESDTQYTRERVCLKHIEECVMSTNPSLHGQERLQDTISWSPQGAEKKLSMLTCR